MIMTPQAKRMWTGVEIFLGADLYSVAQRARNFQKDGARPIALRRTRNALAANQ